MLSAIINTPPSLLNRKDITMQLGNIKWLLLVLLCSLEQSASSSTTSQTTTVSVPETTSETMTTTDNNPTTSQTTEVPTTTSDASATTQSSEVPTTTEDNATTSQSTTVTSTITIDNTTTSESTAVPTITTDATAIIQSTTTMDTATQSTAVPTTVTIDNSTTQSTAVPTTVTIDNSTTQSTAVPTTVTIDNSTTQSTAVHTTTTSDTATTQPTAVPTTATEDNATTTQSTAVPITTTVDTVTTQSTAVPTTTTDATAIIQSTTTMDTATQSTAVPTTATIDNSTTQSTAVPTTTTMDNSTTQSTAVQTPTTSDTATTQPTAVPTTTANDTSTTTTTISNITGGTTGADPATTTAYQATTDDSTTTNQTLNDTTSTTYMSSSTSTDATTTSSVGVPSNVTVSPEVVAVLGMSEDNSRHEPHMVCVFDDPGMDLYFLIKWYINSNLLKTTNYGAVRHNDVNTTAALRPRHWTTNYTLNMNVECSVSAQYLVDSGQGPSSKSSPFFAGIRVSHSTLTINEGDFEPINLTSTLPVGCSASLTDAEKERDCKANLHIITSDWGWCWNGVKYLGVAFPDNGCHVTIPYKYWDQPVILNVTGYVDAFKNWWTRSSRIKFKSTSNPSDLSNAWNNVNIDQTVTAYIRDTSSFSLGGGICGGYNDPHMVTFDRRYWENQRVGEFVMYQHKTKPFAVHALYSTCYPWRAACNCGVAIRSGKNLYVVRTCIEVSLQRVSLLRYPYERYDGCSEEDAITVQKSGSNYRVTLPSGTEVAFSFNTRSHWINYIQIVASSSDLRNTEGICGYYDNDRSNDFVPRNQINAITNEETFAYSWRVDIGAADSLFKKNPEVIYGSSSGGSTTQSAQRYCTCSSFYDYYDQWYNTPFDPNYAKCNLDAPTEPCSERSGQTVNVCTLGRRRRSTAESDDVQDEIEFGYDPDYDPAIKLNVSDWSNGWNETYANTFCNESFTQDLAVTTCIEKVNTSVTEYIDSCVEDIKMIGNADFVQATLDTLKKECVTTASRDSNFSNSTTSDGGSILDLLRSLVCPNNCSGNGDCVNETCSCNGSFVGEDCSKQLSDPPANFTIPLNGVCDTSTRPCQKTNVAGIFYSETIYARCNYFKATPTGRENSTHVVWADVQYRHINLITITIPSAPSSRRRKRATGDVHGWDIELSYDNTTYGNPVIVLLFDSTSKSCDTNTLVCVSKVTAAEAEPADNTGIIVGAVIGGIVVIAVVVGIIIYVKMYKRVKGGRVSASEADLRNTKDSVPLTSTSA